MEFVAAFLGVFLSAHGWGGYAGAYHNPILLLLLLKFECVINFPAPAPPLILFARFTPAAFWESRPEHGRLLVVILRPPLEDTEEPAIAVLVDGIIGGLSVHEEGANDDGGGDAEEEDESWG